jgi:outer membrane protein
MRKTCFVAIGVVALAMFSMVSIAGAEDNYEKFGVRLRAIYVKPDESTSFKADNVKIGDDVIPGIDVEYFFLKNLSTEFFAGVTHNDIKLNNSFAGSTWLLPPTLTVKYHPFAGKTISPYVGFGLNVVFPFNSKISGVDPAFRIDNSVGWTAQAGIDFKLKDNLYFNIDYKYLNADTKMTVGSTKYDLDLNPNLFGIGVGYRF